MSTFVVTGCYRFKSFLSGGIPDL